jgi:hypothetical protein
VYSILFPGAPVPSPCTCFYLLPTMSCCFLLKVQDFERVSEEVAPPQGNQLPGSQNLDDFEAFSRTHLPKLVEAQIQALIEDRYQLLAENLKADIPDIARKSISGLSKAWQASKSSSSLLPASSLDASDAGLDPTSGAQQLSVESSSSQAFGEGLASFFMEPPCSGPQTSPPPSANLFQLDHPVTSVQEHSDSGYASLPEYSCFCGNLFDHIPELGAQPHCAGRNELGEGLELFPASDIWHDESTTWISCSSLNQHDEKGKRGDNSSIHPISRTCDICGGLL